MKKARKLYVDELRSEYKRSDLGVLVRGKYTERLRESSNVVIVDREVAQIAKRASSTTNRPTRD